MPKTTEELERIQIINKLNKYKSNLESNRKKFLIKLGKYYEKDRSDKEKGIYKVKDELKDIKNLNYSNPYEAYLVSQIKIGEKLPNLLEKHITLLEDGDDIDHTLESFEFEVYKVKKAIYRDMEEWEALIDHIPDYRLFEIEVNPKGPGDLLINELLWIKEYEKRLRENYDKK
ncbi:MAG: hypothetical protein QME14_07525 [Methanobacteriaceae archaeon]|nr:hypothetical protein [Methanobacteriaceae archaeon]